ncbi:MAG: hypothetical protein ACK5GN_00240 [Pseudomonadota bacterium]|jgi:hypothetical protein
MNGVRRNVQRVEPVSKISSAPVEEMRAATSSNLAKKSSVYLSGYTCGFFARFPRLASYPFNLATKLVLVLILTTTLTALAGCMGGQGSTDGGSAADGGFGDDTFVADESNTGTIDLRVAGSSIEVGNTSMFTVHARNSRQQPVANMNIACDSEQGVAILDPQRGYALTDSSGVMSGVIGCEAPGSFQFVCRLAVGANRRKFVSVNCTGDVPSGFEGFPGAAGGGLGGGSQTNDDGDVRITSAGFIDNGSAGNESTAGSSIDISQTPDCDLDSSTLDPEPFFDTYVKLVVQNNRAEQVRFEYLQYTMADVDGQGTEFTSKRLGLTQDVDSSLAESGDSSTIIMPVFKAYNRGKYVGDPLGMGMQITNRALITVSFTLVGKTSRGEDVVVKARSTASFGDFLACGAE